MEHVEPVPRCPARVKQRLERRREPEGEHAGTRGGRARGLDRGRQGVEGRREWVGGVVEAEGKVAGEDISGTFVFACTSRPICCSKSLRARLWSRSCRSVHLSPPSPFWHLSGGCGIGIGVRLSPARSLAPRSWVRRSNSPRRHQRNS